MIGKAVFVVTVMVIVVVMPTVVAVVIIVVVMSGFKVFMCQPIFFTMVIIMIVMSMIFEPISWFLVFIYMLTFVIVLV